MDLISVEYIDDVNCRVRCDPGIAQEISEYFTFYVPGYKFMPSYKNKMWDGKIRLFNVYSCTLYVGLINKLRKFALDREYEIVLAKEFDKTSYDVEQFKQFVQKLKPTYTPKNYQEDAVVRAVQDRRALLLSPTASGKSFIIYLITRYFSLPTLIVVPTTSLVNQMYSDFEEYGFNSEKYVHKIYSGHDKNTEKPIVITTWQSVYNLPKSWFARFRVAIGDEAHGFKSKSLTTLMSKMTNCPVKIGLTGTLDGTETNKLVLEGLFGPVYQVTTTKELMDSGDISKLNINALVLQYPESTKASFHRSKPKYEDEIDFIVTNSERNNFIKNLALSLEGNTFVMYRFVEKHGDKLYDLIKNSTDRNVYYVCGSTNTEDRESIRKILEEEKNAIVVCSLGTFSTGVNVKNLHNVIFAHPSKARIKTLQSIGRGLRLHHSKEFLTLYDIADDLSYKSKDNYSIVHFIERIKIYAEQQFSYKIHKVRIRQ